MTSPAAAPAPSSTLSSTPWSAPGLRITDHVLEVPLDHGAAAGPSAPHLSLFARELAAPGGEDRPFLLYLQGGPGFEAPRSDGPSSPPWLARALRDFRVIMLDQRGTGRSTPVGLDSALPEGAIPGASTLREATPAQQADYLALFRADSIVADAELLRVALGAETWTVLGQSFGGFTTLRYLSVASRSVAAAMFTGGLPVLGPRIDEAYALTWDGMIARSERHWSRFPGDRERMRALVDLARSGDLSTADGAPVGPERLRRLGHLLGASGGQEKVHHLLELDPRSPAFRADLAGALPFSGRNPIYAVLHESCWADGGATRWAAQRTMPDAVREDPTLLAGEHVHREAIAEDSQLAPWAEAAELLAAREWPALYDPAALAEAACPVAAAVYYDDAYVPRELSLETASHLRDPRLWITSEFEHNGLRASGEGVLDHLLGLVTGERRG